MVLLRNTVANYNIFSTGNTEVTKLFEGEPGHLIPSTSQIILDGNVFVMAGRIFRNHKMRLTAFIASIIII